MRWPQALAHANSRKSKVIHGERLGLREKDRGGGIDKLSMAGVTEVNEYGVQGKKPVRRDGEVPR